MEETKKALPAGQAESAEGCAGARIEGERNITPSDIVYHEKSTVSTIKPKKRKVFIFGMGLRDTTCVWCGKNFIPTRPEYAWGECCSYTCLRRFEEASRNQKGVKYENAKKII